MTRLRHRARSAAPGGRRVAGLGRLRRDWPRSRALRASVGGRTWHHRGRPDRRRLSSARRGRAPSRSAAGGRPPASGRGTGYRSRTPGIQRLRVLDDRGRTLTEWRSPAADPAPILTGIFFPRPFGLTVRRNGSAIGTIEVWGNSTALTDYIRLGLFAGLVCLLITAIGTIMLARRFEYELVKQLNEIATVAHDVRLHRRFDHRVEPLGIAELDRLGGDINALLAARSEERGGGKEWVSTCGTRGAPYHERKKMMKKAQQQ